jgi:hypothetical protein
MILIHGKDRIINVYRVRSLAEIHSIVGSGIERAITLELSSLIRDRTRLVSVEE